ncbi:hypothetical protein A1O1_07331 [Capronia coronata CBS 617.96]|uniref:Conserved oligomeric Golgi complex subunit 1 n=1 Tax=Capronia coronata CBS 617.96 TaxID=1182541 RepID=W9XT14_9EURO|nr:uncharacterized protein A1O1_07331 [Capronia coronata CBS 617.96]EXJ83707.1 hypothetical protein A1O1_07331 [Capronia coronata CBS 617.96]
MEPGGTIATWQQAFEEYRIPATRAIEKQLRASVTRDKEKLRALVGGSYRELLATAEAIVALDAKTKAAEEHISTISHNCRPPPHDLSARPPSSNKAALAQLRLLQRCCTTSATALRAQNILQCAQLIVISRLLLKSLGDQQGLARSLEILTNKISLLRRRLLRQVDAKLLNPLSTRSDVLDSLCSYCLVTSVSSEDALAYFRQLRLDKIRRQLTKSGDRYTICDALRYQIESLQTFKSLTGRPIADAMNNLQRRPILADATIKELELLDLDTVWSLLPVEIHTFVPYFKRITLSPEEMRSRLEAWSVEASRVLSAALDSHLSNMTNVTDVLEFRKELYTILLPSYFSVPASADIAAQIRHCLNQRLTAICQTQGSRLNDITKLLLEGTNAEDSAKSLWDADLAQASLSNGGSRFIKQVKNRHAGLNRVLSKAARMLDAWILSVNATQNQIDELPKIRWRDIVEEPEEEQEDDASRLIRGLSETDREAYSRELQEALRVSLSEYEKSMVEAASLIADDASSVYRAVTLLRSIRTSLVALQRAFPDDTRFDDLDAIVPKLHEVVANEIARQLSQSTRQGRKSDKLIEAALPEKMPSPAAFSTLRRLCQIMLDIGGTDLWSPPAVHAMKKAIRHQVSDAGQKSNYARNEFDEAYLGAALGHVLPEHSSKDAGSDMTARAAAEYWKRTKSLFGVLG